MILGCGCIVKEDDDEPCDGVYHVGSKEDDQSRPSEVKPQVAEPDRQFGHAGNHKDEEDGTAGYDAKKRENCF